MSIFDTLYNWVMAWPWTPIKDTIDWLSKLIGAFVAIIAFCVAWKSYNSWYKQKRYDIDIQNVKEILSLFYGIRFYIQGLRYDENVRSKIILSSTKESRLVNEGKNLFEQILNKLTELTDKFHVLCEVNACIGGVNVDEQFKLTKHLSMVYLHSLQYKITVLQHNSNPEQHNFQDEIARLENLVKTGGFDIVDVLNTNVEEKSKFLNCWLLLTDELKDVLELPRR